MSSARSSSPRDFDQIELHLPFSEIFMKLLNDLVNRKVVGSKF